MTLINTFWHFVSTMYIQENTVIISKQAAYKMIDKNHAQQVGVIYDANCDKSYVVLNDIVKQQTLHCFLGDGDLRRDNEIIGDEND